MPRLTALRKLPRIGARVGSQLKGRGDVVRVPIAAGRVVGNDNLRAGFAHHVHQPADYLVGRRLHEGVGVLVVVRSGHAESR